MKPCLRILPILFIAAALILAGCEGDDGVGPAEPVDAPGWISQGWSQYSTGDYDNSAESFDHAVDLAESSFWDAYEDSVFATAINDTLGIEEAVAEMAVQIGYLVEGLSGIGWCMIEFADFATGTFVFTTALELDPSYEEAMAGHAFLLQAHEEWQQSNEKIAMLLEMNSTWSFAHDQSIDYLDLQLSRSKNNYFLCEFEASQEDALELAAGLGYDTPSELATLIGLPTFSFNLGTIEGRSALILLIDALEDMI